MYKKGFQAVLVLYVIVILLLPQGFSLPQTESAVISQSAFPSGVFGKIGQKQSETTSLSQGSTPLLQVITEDIVGQGQAGQYEICLGGVCYLSGQQQGSSPPGPQHLNLPILPTEYYSPNLLLFQNQTDSVNIVFSMGYEPVGVFNQSGLPSLCLGFVCVYQTSLSSARNCFDDGICQIGCNAPNDPDCMGPPPCSSTNDGICPPWCSVQNDVDCVWACNNVSADGNCPAACTANNDIDCRPSLCAQASTPGCCGDVDFECRDCFSFDPDCDTSCSGPWRDGICPASCDFSADLDCPPPECLPDNNCPVTCSIMNDPDCDPSDCSGVISDNNCPLACTPSNDIDCRERGCVDDDFLCPIGCNAGTDNDCAPGECSGIISDDLCPAGCDSTNDIDCAQSSCPPGDLFCPIGYHAGNDYDCALPDSCSGIIKDAVCNPGCTSSNDADCDAPACVNNDHICPIGCTAGNDNDCMPGSCSGILSDDTCPACCDESNDIDCIMRDEPCQDFDGVCPIGCTELTDNDCYSHTVLDMPLEEGSCSFINEPVTIGDLSFETGFYECTDPGSFVQDHSPYENHGDLVGGRAKGQLLAGIGLSAGDHITIPYERSLELGSATIKLWIKPLMQADQVLIDLDGSWRLSLLVDGSLRMNQPGLSESMFQTGQGVIPMGVWTMVAYTYDQEKNESWFFVNGEPLLSQTVSGIYALAGGQLTIGADNSLSSPFTGLIDQVLIMRRALDASEVKSLYTTEASCISGDDSCPLGCNDAMDDDCLFSCSGMTPDNVCTPSCTSMSEVDCKGPICADNDDLCPIWCNTRLDNDCLPDQCSGTFADGLCLEGCDSTVDVDCSWPVCTNEAIDYRCPIMCNENMDMDCGLIPPCVSDDSECPVGCDAATDNDCGQPGPAACIDNDTICPVGCDEITDNDCWQTILLDVPFEGTTRGNAGEYAWLDSLIQYQHGKVGQSVLFDGSSSLSYPTRGDALLNANGTMMTLRRSEYMQDSEGNYSLLLSIRGQAMGVDTFDGSLLLRRAGAFRIRPMNLGPGDVINIGAQTLTGSDNDVWFPMNKSFSYSFQASSPKGFDIEIGDAGRFADVMIDSGSPGATIPYFMGKEFITSAGPGTLDINLIDDRIKNLDDAAGTIMFYMLPSWNSTSACPECGLFSMVLDEENNLGITASNGKVNLIKDGTIILSQPLSNPMGYWHHVAASYDVGIGEYQLVIDCLSENHTTSPASSLSLSQEMTIGNTDDGLNPALVAIDELKIFGSRLTEGDICDEYWKSPHPKAQIFLNTTSDLFLFNEPIAFTPDSIITNVGNVNLTGRLKVEVDRNFHDFAIDVPLLEASERTIQPNETLSLAELFNIVQYKMALYPGMYNVTVSFIDAGGLVIETESGPLTSSNLFYLDYNDSSPDDLILPFESTTWPLVGMGGEWPLYNMTTQQDITQGGGRVGRAIQMDGNDTLRYKTGLNMNQSQGTIMMFVKPGSIGLDEKYLFDEDSAAAVRIWQKNDLVLAEVDGNTLQAAVPWDSEVWSHIALTWDTENDAIKLYIDCNLEAEISPASLSMSAIDSFLSIGSTHEGTKSANASLDQVKIFSKVLSGDEICWEIGPPVGYECQPDCTFATDDICHAECQGQSSCQFATPAAQSLCDEQLQGFEMESNGSIVECCTGPLVQKDLYKIDLTLNDIPHLITKKQVVYRKGKPVELVIVSYEGP